MASTSDNSSHDAVVEEKKELRKLIRSKIKLLSKEELDRQSKQVWDRLFELPQYKECKSIGLFLSMPKNEINTDCVIQDATKNNKTIYVPQVGKNFEHADMELVKVITTTTTEDEEKLFHKKWPKNKWGIPEPPDDMPIVTAKPGDIDLLVVPGLAFDRNGNRLGQGKGYYDRFIARMVQDKTGEANDSSTKVPFLVSVGLQVQVVEKVPVEKYDRGMNIVLLPDQSIVVEED